MVTPRSALISTNVLTMNTTVLPTKSAAIQMEVLNVRAQMVTSVKQVLAVTSTNANLAHVMQMLHAPTMTAVSIVPATADFMELVTLAMTSMSVPLELINVTLTPVVPIQLEDMNALVILDMTAMATAVKT